MFNEEAEAKILIRIVLKVDNFLYNNLPNEIYDLIRSSKDGIDEKEAQLLTARLTKLINKNVDIPYIPEAIEHIAFEFLIKTIIEAARKSKCL